MATLTHEAVLYGSDDEFVLFAAAFVREGLQAREPVVVVTSGHSRELLADALGGSVRNVEFVDADRWYQRPAATIAAYRAAVDEHLETGARSVRVVGEVRFGTTPHEHAEWTRYESVMNRVFDGSPVRVVCPYDTRVLPPRVVADARRTHPLVSDADGRRWSDEYVDPAPGRPDPFAGYLPPDPLDEGGRGFWLARQLVDAMEVAPTTLSGGLTVRMQALL